MPTPTPSLVTRIGEADLKLLRVFRTVVESGGLSAAENQLNIGRSTISKYLADLELRLDLKLCHRGPSGFALTEEGATVLEAADRLLAAVMDFRIEVNEIKQNLVGVVRVALFDQCGSNPEARLSSAIRSFNQSAPAVNIDLSLEPPNQIESKVVSGQLDIGIIADYQRSGSLKYHPLYGENMYLYCGRGHEFFDCPQSELELANVRSVNYAGIGVTSPNLHASQKLMLKRAATVQSEHALAILILSGCYIGFLPDHLARDFEKQGRLKAVRPDEFHYRTTFSAAIRRSPETHRIAKLFLDALVNEHT
ncbi:LysR family transcriptional regulator [Fluviibacterium sp. DFM31]|uniref:LysR family transcriptional regulator n=1 Tax=Meridianimarinicoccus marinus TaxID=3231483 RepID=A0ABV3LBL5_9RHOB